MRTSLIPAVLFSLISCFSGLAAAVESPSTPPAKTSSTLVSEGVSAVDINTADAETLQGALLGIGAVKAQAIIEYRDANGPFASVDELLEVKGIGASTLEKNRDRLSLK